MNLKNAHITFNNIYKKRTKKKFQAKIDKYFKTKRIKMFYLIIISQIFLSNFNSFSNFLIDNSLNQKKSLVSEKDRSIKPNFAADSVIINKNSSVNLSYYIEINIKSLDMSIDFKDNLDLDLHILGDQKIYNNGTINYSVNKNVTDQTILNLMNFVFPKSIINYISNHKENSNISSYFSNRVISSCNSSLCYIDGIYSVFWINTSNNIGDLSTSINIPYWKVSTPISLNIQKNIVKLSEYTFNSKEFALSYSKRVINAYYLNYNGFICQNYSVNLDLYYDTRWTQLLRMDLLYIDENVSNPVEYNFNFILKSTTLSLEFSDDNPYYQNAQIEKRNHLIIGFVSIIIIFIAIIYLRIYKTKKCELPQLNQAQRNMLFNNRDKYENYDYEKKNKVDINMD